MRSEGCDDKVRGRRVPGCGRARFRVGRRDYSPRRGHSGRGFNIVVINGMTGTLIVSAPSEFLLLIFKYWASVFLSA